MKYISSIILMLIMTSCYISKTLEHEVHVKLNEDFSIKIVNEGDSEFSNKFSKDEYRQKYLTGLKEQLRTNKIIADGENPMFEITISELSIKETTKIDTVKDAASNNNGKVFELTTLDVNANGTLVNIRYSSTSNWTADKSDSEKMTNSRSAGQVITGDNKDNEDYREKELDDVVCGNLVEVVGRRSGTRINNVIVKAVKK